jgi:hypothetical protein
VSQLNPEQAAELKKIIEIAEEITNNKPSEPEKLGQYTSLDPQLAFTLARMVARSSLEAMRSTGRIMDMDGLATIWLMGVMLGATYERRYRDD